MMKPSRRRLAIPKTTSAHQMSNNESATATTPPQPSLNPHPTSPASVLYLQQTLGNKATSHLISPAATPIQRDYINQSDRVGTLKKALSTVPIEKKSQEAVAVGHVLEAIIGYQSLDKPAVDSKAFGALKIALKNIKFEAERFASRFSSSPAAAIMQQVASEASVVIDDWISTEILLKEMEDPRWKEDARRVGQVVREIDVRIKKYNDGYRQKINSAIYFILDQARIQANQASREWQDRKDLEEGGFEYGDAQGKLTEELRVYMLDYSAIREFLGNKAHFLKFMRWLANIIAKSGKENKVDALKQELGRVESEMGFAPQVVVPLGILPADAFFDLLAEGRVLDDFGAGLQHGELSHRLQWYAIYRAWNIGELGLKIPPIDLYKALGKAPFKEANSGTSMWGSLLDKATLANQSNYSFPGTLNHDLQHADPKFDTKGAGLFGYGSVSDYKLPETEGLEPLGEALRQLKELRTQEMRTADPEALKSPDWLKWGTPTQPAVDAKEKELREKEGYQVYAEGVVDSKSAFSAETEKSRWRVLIEKSGI